VGAVGVRGEIVVVTGEATIVAEAGQQRHSAHHRAGLVAGVTERLGHQAELLVEDETPVVPDAVHRWQHTGQDGGDGRAGDRRRRHAVGEAHATAGQAVQGRRRGALITGAAEAIVPGGVHDDQDHRGTVVAAASDSGQAEAAGQQAETQRNDPPWRQVNSRVLSHHRFTMLRRSFPQ